MVFGNRGATSATGVLFTRNPATGEPTLYGDVMFDAQGEDVVAGTHRTEPIAVLDERLPAVAAELRDDATRLERHYADLCDIEFTIEEGRLWMLQVRVGKRSPQAALRIAVDMAEDETFPVSRADAVERVAALLAHPPTTTSARSSFVLPLATGLPASPGMASGPIVTSPEAAQEAAEAGTAGDPRPGRDLARRRPRDGQGGRDPDVARRPGEPRRGRRARLGDPGGRRRGRDRGPRRPGRRRRPGPAMPATSSRSTAAPGEVFEGTIPGTTEVVPEARTLLAWAKELGIAVGEEPTSQRTRRACPPRRLARSTPDDCLRAIAIKGFAQTQGVADVVAFDTGRRSSRSSTSSSSTAWRRRSRAPTG